MLRDFLDWMVQLWMDGTDDRGLYKGGPLSVPTITAQTLRCLSHPSVPSVPLKCGGFIV